MADISRLSVNALIVCADVGEDTAIGRATEELALELADLEVEVTVARSADEGRAVPFDKKADRNSAFRQTLYGARRVPNNIVVLTFKNSLVVMTHIRNRHLSQQTIGQLKSLGAK